MSGTAMEKKATMSGDGSSVKSSDGAVVSHRPATGATALNNSDDGELGEFRNMDDDDKELAERMGYKSEFAREFKSLSVISYAFSIMGLISSVVTTFNVPFLSGGGYAGTIWAWFMGSCFNMFLGSAIAHIVSAYPSAGGLYSAAGLLVPKKYRAITAWCMAWLNFTGQIAGIAGTAYGLSQMIWAYAYVATGYVPGGGGIVFTGAIVGMYCAIMVIHGIICSLDNKYLSKLTSGYVFVNLGITVVVAVAVLVRGGQAGDLLPASVGFGEVSDPTGYNSLAFAFLVSLSSVQFVMTDYDATAHMSEDIHRASYAAPVAIFIAVAGTGLFGFFLNIAMVFASGTVLTDDPTTFPGGLAFAQILLNRLGRPFFLVVWPFIMAVAWFVITTATQANARSFYAFSRDKGLPDRGFFARVNKRTRQPINAVWLVVVLCIALVMLAFASQIAVFAIFSLAAFGMDLSYLIPIIALQIYQDHPDVQFEPGPFNLGRGFLGKFVNYVAIIWTLFECTILAFPLVMPYAADTFNYSWVIAGGVLLIAIPWYFIGARKHYEGPRSVLSQAQLEKLGVVVTENEGENKPSH